MRLTRLVAFFPPFLPEGIIGFQRALPRFSRHPEGCAGSARAEPKPSRGLPKMPAFQDRQVPALPRRPPKGSSVRGRRCLELTHAPEGMRVLSRRVAPFSTAMPEGLVVSIGARRPFPFGPKPSRKFTHARPEAHRDGPGTVVFAPEGGKTRFALANPPRARKPAEAAVPGGSAVSYRFGHLADIADEGPRHACAPEGAPPLDLFPDCV